MRDVLDDDAVVDSFAGRRLLAHFLSPSSRCDLLGLRDMTMINNNAMNKYADE